MKRFLVLTSILSGVFLLQSCVFIVNRKETKLLGSDASQRFETIQESFIEKPNKIKQYGAADAYKTIVNNIESFEKLKTKVLEANNIAEVMDDIAEELSVIAKNYRKVANMAGSIEKFTVKSMDELLAGQSTSNKSVDLNDIEIRMLTEEMERAKLKLERADDSNEIMRLEATVAGNSSQINSLKGQNKMWLNFLNYQERLLGALNKNNESVSTLLFVLDKNADVYETAAETAQMTKSAARFIQDLNGLIDINNTLGDLIDSWDEVDFVVDEIISLDFETL